MEWVRIADGNSVVQRPSKEAKILTMDWEKAKFYRKPLVFLGKSMLLSCN
jgi:hypothetical protein